MKKSLLVLHSLLALFVLYSCDKDEPDKIRYLDNKLIEEKWYGIVARDSMVYTFKDNMATHEFYAFILGMDELKFEEKTEFGNYLLTDSCVILPPWTGREI